MARPLKTGLDYFPLDVGFFGNKKIKRLRAKFGCEGVSAYIYILCLIYGGEGYYTDWDEYLTADLSIDLNLPEERANQIIDFCIEIGLLRANGLHNGEKILSSEAIQLRFQNIRILLKRNVEVRKECWFLKEAETRGYIKFVEDDVAGFYGKNEDKS